MTDEPPAHLIDWHGNDWTPGVAPTRPRTRTRASRRPAAQDPAIAPEWEDPAGVPIDAMLFGGRRSTVVPLVTEAFDWEHGVFLGATMSSEKTAAAAGTVGELRFDPFAMLPFCGYDMAEYFAHWLEIGRTTGAKLPKIFYVNWFRKDEDGRFLWPGYGENSRVLAWVFARCAGHGAASETPIGLMPPTGPDGHRHARRRRLRRGHGRAAARRRRGLARRAAAVPPALRAVLEPARRARGAAARRSKSAWARARDGGDGGRSAGRAGFVRELGVPPGRCSRSRSRPSAPGTPRKLGAKIDPWLVRVSGGRLDSALGTIPVGVLHVRGARSGVERKVPLLYFNDGEDVILIASSYGRPKTPSWYFNLKANPDVTPRGQGPQRLLPRAGGRGS